jgi:large subunit ribosomal protein L25
MEQIELKAESRTLAGRHVKKLRAQGYVPAVVYGSQVETKPIQVEGKVLHKVLAKAGGNTLISLQIGDAEPVLTLAREVQRDIIRHNVLHVDFYQVVMTERIAAQVPLVLTGEAPAVEHGGVLVHGLNTVEVQCLPADLPSVIEVDLSPLAEFNDFVSVADLEVPSSITVLSDLESVIARIEAPRIVEEEVEVVEEEVEVAAEPELVGRVEREEEIEEPEE